jgi:hypothetical protein
MQPLEATQREELGPLVGEHHQPGTVLWLFRKGLFVEHRRTRFAGAFDDILHGAASVLEWAKAIWLP